MAAQASSPRTTLFILLGASEWPQFPEFGSSQAFANAAKDVKNYFLDPERFGIPLENALDIFDSNNTSDELDAQISQFIEQRIATMKANGQEARDLLVYFVGHGGFIGRDSDFYLAIRRTRMENPRASGLSMLALADTLTEKARYLRRIIVLDCCFAAAAFSAFQAGPTQIAIEKTVDAFEVKQKRGGFPARGTTLLCSSGHKSPSRLLPDGSSTMFTKAVLEVLEEGITSQQDRLSLREVKDLTADVLSATRDAPKPTVLSPDQSEGDVADIPFFPNPYVKMERTLLAEEERRRQIDKAEQTHNIEAQRRRIEAERTRKAEAELARRQAQDKQARQVEEMERIRKIDEPLPPITATPSSNPPRLPPPTVEPLYTKPKQQPAKSQIDAASLPQPVRRNTNFLAISGICLLLVILIGSGILFAVNHRGSLSSTTNTSSAPTDGKQCTKVGVLLPETAASARWENQDKPLLTQDIQAIQAQHKVNVDYYNAQGDALTQQTQANTALARGDCILVVAADDTTAATNIVTAAKAENVPVIAYDRLIQSKDLNYYVSFDNVQTGKLQGQYIVDHYRDYTQNGNNNVVMIDGSPTDNSAHLFQQGASSILQPLFTNGKLKKIDEQYTPNWDNATARTEMDGVLTAYNNNVQIAYVANDGMANSVIASLQAQHLNGKVLVTGQDATIAGIHNILTGDQAMTVYKSLKAEAQATATLIQALIQGKDTSFLTRGTTSQTLNGSEIPSVLLTQIAVDKTNIKKTVIADGFVTKSDICSGLPSGTDGIC